MNTMIKKVAYDAVTIAAGYVIGDVVCKVVVKPIKKKLKTRKEK